MLGAAFVCLVILSPLLATAAYAFRRARRGDTVLGPTLLLLAPAVPWVLFYGYAWFHRGNPSAAMPVEPLINQVTSAVIYVTPIIALVVVYLARGYRWAALALGVANSFVGTGVALLALMTISGNWI